MAKSESTCWTGCQSVAGLRDTSVHAHIHNHSNHFKLWEAATGESLQTIQKGCNWLVDSNSGHSCCETTVLTVVPCTLGLTCGGKINWTLKLSEIYWRNFCKRNTTAWTESAPALMLNKQNLSSFILRAAPEPHFPHHHVHTYLIIKSVSSSFVPASSLCTISSTVLHKG